MNIARISRCVLSLSVTTPLLAGCGGSQPPNGAPGAMALATSELKPAPRKPGYKATDPVLYVSNDGDHHNVTVYPADAKDPSPIETISSGLAFPAGICLDGQGTRYVVDIDGWVAEYPAGKTKRSKVITKGIDTPAFCAIDGSGNLWVTNIYGANVTEYLQGSTKPHTVITKGLTYPDGIAIDHSGNMYVGNGGDNGFGPYSVIVYAHGSKSPSRTITDGVTGPVGIAVDANDTLYVANDHTSSTKSSGNVEEYRAGQSRPYQTITYDEPYSPEDVVVSRSGWLYVSVWPHYTNSNPFAILEYRPHSLKPSSRQITKGLYLPTGVAYYPPLLP